MPAAGPLGAGVRSLGVERTRFSERGRRRAWFVDDLKPELAPGAQRELRRSDIGVCSWVGDAAVVRAASVPTFARANCRYEQADMRSVC